MVIFLYGADDYRRGKKRTELTHAFLKKHPESSVEAISLEGDAGRDKLERFLEMRSLFAASRMLVVEGAYELPAKEAERLVDLAKGIKDAVLIISESKKPLKAYSFLLGKKSEAGILSQEFEPLTGPAWAAFIRKEAKEAELSLEEKGLSALANATQGNSWTAVTEIKKLALLRDPKRAEEMCTELGGMRMDFWAMVNGLRGRSLGDRMRSLFALGVTGEPEAKTFSILAASAREDRDMYANLDLQVKSGKLEYEEAMLSLALI